MPKQKQKKPQAKAKTRSQGQHKAKRQDAPRRLPDGYYGERDNRRYILDDDRISRGTEGSIHRCHAEGEPADAPPLVTKLMEGDNPARLEKLKALLDIVTQNHLERKIPQVMWPKQLLIEQKNGQRRVAGYLMKYCPWPTMFSTIKRSRWLAEKHWTRKELVDYTLKLLDTFELLHKHGFLMGDVCLMNILCDYQAVKPAFVDADSYQFETDGHTYVCPGWRDAFSTPTFVADRIANNGTPRELRRTLEDEYHAITVLIFEILMGGIHPYATAGSFRLEERICGKQFDFPIETELGNCAHAKYRIWFYLPCSIRYAFYEAFVDGRYKSPKEWGSLLKRYRKDMELGHYYSSVLLSNADQFTDQGGVLRIEHKPYDASDKHYQEFHDMVYHPADQQEDGPVSALVIHDDSLELITCLNPAQAQAGVLRAEDLQARRVTNLDHCSLIDADAQLIYWRLKPLLLPAITNLWKNKTAEADQGTTVCVGTDWLRVIGNRKFVVRRLRSQSDVPIGIITIDEEQALHLKGLVANAKAAGVLHEHQPLLHIELSHTGLFIEAMNPQGEVATLVEDLGLTVLYNSLTHRSDNHTMLSAAIEDLRFTITRHIQRADLSGIEPVMAGFEQQPAVLLTGPLWKYVHREAGYDIYPEFGQSIAYDYAHLNAMLHHQKDYLVKHQKVTDLQKTNVFNQRAMIIVLGLLTYLHLLKRLQLEQQPLHVLGNSLAYGLIMSQCEAGSSVDDGTDTADDGTDLPDSQADDHHDIEPHNNIEHGN